MTGTTSTINSYNVSECISRKRDRDILIIETDSNSSIGILPDKTDCIGMFGNLHLAAMNIYLFIYIYIFPRSKINPQRY